MSESEHSSKEPGDILDWALVDSHGDLEDGDSSSTTSSVEVMAEEEESHGEGPVTGPKFVLRLASREHLGPDSDEEGNTGKAVSETESFDVIQSPSTVSQDGGLASAAAPRPSNSADPGVRTSERQGFQQQISQNDIDQLVQAITEVQSSVSPSGAGKSLFGNSIAQESETLRKEINNDSLTLPTERSRLPVDLETESLESSVSSRFSFLTRERGSIADFEDSDTERLRTDSQPVTETLGQQENQYGQEPATCSVLYRAPEALVQQQGEDEITQIPPVRRSADSVLYTIKLLDKIFNLSVVAVVAFAVIMVCYHTFIGPAGQTKIVSDEAVLLRSQKVEADKLIAELRNDMLRQNSKNHELNHQHFVETSRLKKSLEQCKINLNDAEQENSDLKSEVIRLKYSIQHVQETAVKAEKEESKVASGDTPYIHCGPGKIMKRHHEVDGDTMYFCDWDKSQQVPEKEAPPGDSDILAVEGFCEKILGDEGREISRKYKKLKKMLKPVCRKVLRQEDPDQTEASPQPEEENTIPCQSCYQKLSQVENNWLNAENEKEAAVSRAELWKELYTRAIEREAEHSKMEEDSQESKEPENSSRESLSLRSCWKFVVSNLTAGNHLFESFGLYWEEVENLMPKNFSSLFDFWIHSKWTKPPQDDSWQENNKDDEPEIHSHPDDVEEGPWTGDDDKEGPEGQFDWGDTVNNVLNKTKESVSSVNKQIQDTWKQVKNMSKQLWEKHEPAIMEMHDAFTEKLTKLGERFQERLQKKTQHWFKKFNKEQEKERTRQDNEKQEPKSRQGKHRKGCKSKGESGVKKDGTRKEPEILKKQKGRQGRAQNGSRNNGNVKTETPVKKNEQMKKGAKEVITEEKWEPSVNIEADSRSGRTKRRPHLNVGGVDSDMFTHEDVDDNVDDENVIVVPYVDEPFYEKKEDKGATPSCKFVKLHKAANSLKWRAKNIDTWANLAEEHRVIGERLMLNDVYQQVEEEEMPSDQQSWYDCQLAWWSSNLRGTGSQTPDHCKNKLEQFQRDRKVVDPKQWQTQRILDADKAVEKDPCFLEKLEIIYSLLQYKLDLFQIDMCRHRIPPCTYREHLFMNMEEIRQLFQDVEFGSQSDQGTGLQKNWLFERAELREHLRETSVNDDGDDDNSIDDDEDYYVEDDKYDFFEDE